MNQEILQLSAMGIILLFTIKELFAYLKTRKIEGNNGLNGAILRELQSMNQNHLNELRKTIEEGNNRLIDSIHSDNIKIIELLGEIRGRLK